jgi:hypothetical protein
VVVIYPDSHQFTLNDNLSVLSSSKLTFYIDFPYTGNYSVLLVDGVNNRALASTSFEISTLPTILGGYLFGQGIGFLFGALGPIITIFLERISKMHDERTRVLESKSQWMINYAKEYGQVGLRSRLMYCMFQHGSKIKTFYGGYVVDSAEPLKFNVDSAKLLTAILRWWLAYHILLRKAGGFYFDNLRAEVLAYSLSENIVKQIGDIFKDLNFQSYVELRKEHQDKNSVKVIDEDKDNFYRSTLREWLTENRPDVERFYKNLLLFRSIILLGLNTALTITYSNPAGLLTDLRALLESEPEITSHLRSIENYERTDIFDLFPQFSKWNRFS